MGVILLLSVRGCCPKVNVLGGYLHMVVVAFDVEAAFGREAWQTLRMKDELLQLVIDIFFIGKHIDYGT